MVLVEHPHRVDIGVLPVMGLRPVQAHQVDTLILERMEDLRKVRFENPGVGWIKMDGLESFNTRFTP